MSEIINWWGSLTLGGQVFGLIAVAGTAVLIIQLVFLMFGFGDDGDSDFDDGVGLNLFTSRGIMAFIALFGWCGVACLESGMSGFIAMLMAIAAGLAGMFLMALAFLGFTKLQSDGTADINNAAGTDGTVYVPIPPQRSGTGKVNVIVSGSLKEYDAYTDHTETLQTKQPVKVIEVTNNNILVVMPHSGGKEE